MAARRWMYVVGGVAVVLIFLGIGAAIVGVTWVTSHTHVAQATESSSEGAFEAVHAEFAGQRPLIDTRDGRPRLDESRTTQPASSRKLTEFHVLVWAPKDGKLVKVDLPFWLLRLKSKPIEFSSYASGLDDVGITMTAEELERYGPGILLDMEPRGGERILLWVK